MLSQQCKSCLNRFEQSTPEGWPRCLAFLNGIPEAIITGEFDHTNPYPNDGGIRFEEEKLFLKEE